MKVLVIIIFFFSSLYANGIENNQTVKVLCFDDESTNSFCKSSNLQVVLLPSQLSIADKLIIIQNEIRTNTSKKQKVILLARGFMGTLLSIAQTNLLPYYRKNIVGMALEDSPPNVFNDCYVEKKDNNSTVCQEIITFRKDLGTLASKSEMFIALSPALQMDWYWSNTLIIGNKYKKDWLKAFDENSIEYFFENDFKVEKILEYFPLKMSNKIQPKNKILEPKHHGPLLRFHLNKIYYQEKNQILVKEDESYGIDIEQSYDVYFKEESKSNPLMIYVHGGGWTKGDKKSYKYLCKQYADRGFTAVSINYRLLDHPRVTMEEMVDDVQTAIEDVLKNAKFYKANSSKVLVMAESAGGQLATLAMTRLASHKISVAVFNSISTDLHLFPKKKQVRLSKIEDDKERKKWLNRYSPVNQLDKYRVPTFIAHSFNDYGVPAEHLENFELLSALHSNNITSFWIEGGMHPVVPKVRSLQPSYIDIENENIKFIYDNLLEE